MTASMDETTGEITVHGKEVGTFYFSYRVTDGPTFSPVPGRCYRDDGLSSSQRGV